MLLSSDDYINKHCRLARDRNETKTDEVEEDETEVDEAEVDDRGRCR